MSKEVSWRERPYPTSGTHPPLIVRSKENVESLSSLHGEALRNLAHQLAALLAQAVVLEIALMGIGAAGADELGVV